MKFLRRYEQYDKEPFAACENPEVPMGKWLLQHLPGKPDSLLDVGCGTGIHTRWFNEQGIETIGITINPAEIEQCVHENVQYGNMLDIPFENEVFDCVFCLGTLEHTHVPFIALCEFNRVLKDAGYLFFDMCGLNNSFILDERFYYHKSILLPIQIKDLLIRTGFKMIDGRYTDSIIDNKYYQAAITGSCYLSQKDRRWNLN